MLRQPELLGRQDLRGDDAEHRAGPLAVHERVAAEARDARQLVGEVGIVPLAKLALVLLAAESAATAP